MDLPEARASCGKRDFRISVANDQSLSLVFALQAAARAAGCDLDLDATTAALGLSLMTCAVPGEENLARWPLHGRDAFLVEGGRAVGTTIRPVHPPQAARGLEGAEEFRQHFEASYRPLILRALEHGQAVLAWRGWPGDRGGLWGIISDTCRGGVGLCGFTMTPEGRSVDRASGGRRGHQPLRTATVDLPVNRAADAWADHGPVVLQSPPVQLYFVERFAGAGADPEALFAVVLDHARRVLANELTNTLGLVTGPAACDAWIARLIHGDAEDSARSGLSNGHCKMAAAVVAGRQSAIRFLTRYAAHLRPERRSLVEVLVESCHAAVTALSESVDPAAVATAVDTPAGRCKLADQVAAARAAATKALIALQSRSRTGAGA
jgi:hypothetical protein